METTRKHSGPRMSGVVMHGETIYLSGQVADNRDGGTGAQTSDILSKIERLLADAGSNKSKILSATIYLTDIRDFAAMNEVWDAWVDQGNPPARTTVEAKLAAPAVRVEMTMIAAR